ncbi:MAG: molybdopterin-dependent oxidoreductase [Thermodesulfobacteriota bacterium]
MSQWHKTGCVLCAQNCGLEVKVENNRIVRVRPDKDNPRSEGYSCRKGLNIAFYQHHNQRLTHPLKRVDGRFEKVSWDQALTEIAARLKDIVSRHGPRSLAYMGGGGQGCHFEAAFGVRFMRGLGSQYHYSPLAQELTGHFWVYGRMLGRQNLLAGPDHHRTDLLLALGWNPWMSHQMPQARREVDRLSKDPNKKFMVIDPRRTESAQRADIHLAIRPGTDALLLKAMIAIILAEGWHNQAYINAHVANFDRIESWFKNFDARGAVKVCELDFETVREVSRLLATMNSSLHGDLGVLMGRHSTACSYLQMLLLAVCGRIGVPGGNVILGGLMPLGVHSDERQPKTWRTVATGFPAIMGTFPPNVMPEEIMSDHPERLRAVLVSQSNPLRSYADTTKYEEAFGRLDLLVTIELALTETAALSHYVLPARSGYESWDGTFFPWTFPEIYFQMRRPIIEPEGEPLEAGEIIFRLADRLGLVPEIPTALDDAAQGCDHLKYGEALLEFAAANPSALKVMPFVLAKTLGRAMGSAHLSALWGLTQTVPAEFRGHAARAGFDPGPKLGEDLFQAILNKPEGLWIGRLDPEKNLAELKTADGRIEAYIPELEAEVKALDAAGEAEALRPDPRFPLILAAGRHMDFNANSLMRDPAWNKGKRDCTLAMHPQDAAGLGLIDGQKVKVATEAGQEEVELEVTTDARPGHVIMPHGFGLVYENRKYGANVNRLTKNTNRDPIAATPLHRYVPCRVEAA